MESHKASFFHEQIYLENFQFTKYSKLHGNRRLNKFITTLETYPVSAAILKEVPSKRNKNKAIYKTLRRKIW